MRNQLAAAIVAPTGMYAAEASEKDVVLVKLTLVGKEEDGHPGRGAGVLC